MPDLEFKLVIHQFRAWCATEHKALGSWKDNPEEAEQEAENHYLKYHHHVIVEEKTVRRALFVSAAPLHTDDLSDRL